MPLWENVQRFAGFERLIPRMTDDAEDRHVLAAAVHGGPTRDQTLRAEQRTAEGAIGRLRAAVHADLNNRNMRLLAERIGKDGALSPDPAIRCIAAQALAHIDTGEVLLLRLGDIDFDDRRLRRWPTRIRIGSATPSEPTWPAAAFVSPSCSA